MTEQLDKKHRTMLELAARYARMAILCVDSGRPDYSQYHGILHCLQAVVHDLDMVLGRRVEFGELAKPWLQEKPYD
jgi:hypothetical protein